MKLWIHSDIKYLPDNIGFLGCSFLNECKVDFDENGIVKVVPKKNADGGYMEGGIEIDNSGKKVRIYKSNKEVIDI